MEAVLKDEIDCRIVKEQGATGSVRIYPGQKLFVKKVPTHGEKVVCVTKDEKLLADVIRDEKDYGLPVEFTIPRRDFELGYFRVCPETMKLQDTLAAAPADESETIDEGDGLGE